jgi:hypothetical protein
MAVWLGRPLLLAEDDLGVEAEGVDLGYPDDL